MIGQVWPGARVIGSLGFESNQAAFDMNIPATTTGTVNTVGGSHHLVEAPAITVTVFPLPIIVGGDTMATGEGFAFARESAADRENDSLIKLLEC